MNRISLEDIRRKSLYSPDVLSGVLMERACTDSDVQFAEFQLRVIGAVVQFDPAAALSISVDILNDGVPTRVTQIEIDHREGDRPAGSDRFDAPQKAFLRTLMRAPGCAGLHPAPKKSDPAHAAVAKSGQRAPKAQRIGVAYRFPFKNNRFIIVSIAMAQSQPMLRPAQLDTFEFAAFPFFLGWLHKFDVICAGTLEGWLRLCEGMTLAQFRVLRAVAGTGVGNAKSLSKILGVAPGTVYRHIENSYEALAEKCGHSATDHSNANRILEISHRLRFFEFGPGQPVNRAGIR